MNKFNERRTRSVEKMVKTFLNGRGFDLNFASNRYSPYDLIGFNKENKPLVIEVKNRANYYKSKNFKGYSWFIDKSKIDKLLSYKCKSYIIKVCNGYLLIYNTKTISNYNIVEVPQNRTTNEGYKGQGEKVMKKSYEFPAEAYIQKIKL